MGDSADDIRRALAFVNKLELPPAPRRTRGTPRAKPQPVFSEGRSGARIVGSAIVSSSAGTTSLVREFIINSSLLAQLAANRRVPMREDVFAWYDAYFETLDQLGWVIQERGFSEHRNIGNQVDVHQAILSVASTILSQSAAALMVVEATMKAMELMADGAWLRIFNRESRAEKEARFQFTVTESESERGSTTVLMAFELRARSTLTQVLFFKFPSADVTLRHASGRVAINPDLVAEINPVIARKVSAFTSDFIEDLPI